MKILLIVLFSVLALLFLLAAVFYFLKVRLAVRYDSFDRALFFAVKVGVVTIPIYPPRKKKSTKMPTLAEALAEKARKDEKKKKSKENGGKNPFSAFQKELSAVARATHIGGAISARRKKDVSDNRFVQKARRIAAAIRIFVARARAFLPTFSDAITLSVDSLHITAASADAADTAIGYGVLCGALETLCAASRECERLHLSDDIRVDTDFCSDKPQFSVSAHADVRVFKVLVAFYRAEDAYYTEKYR